MGTSHHCPARCLVVLASARQASTVPGIRSRPKPSAADVTASERAHSITASARTRPVRTIPRPAATNPRPSHDPAPCPATALSMLVGPVFMAMLLRLPAQGLGARSLFHHRVCLAPAGRAVTLRPGSGVYLQVPARHRLAVYRGAWLSS